MASNSSLLLLLIVAVACFISPAISQTCSTQNITSTGRTRFDTCLDLPVLDSYLHYTYNAANSSLSVAFVATPARPTGWVAWGINPTGTGMAGTQAFVALRSGPGMAPVLRTFNISSYSSLVEGRLAFEFWDLRAEALSGDRIVIYTSVKVPAGEDSVNQVWQIGGNVTNGRIGVHPFSPANLNSRGLLSFTASDAPSSAPSSGPGSAPSSGPGSAPSSGPGSAPGSVPGSAQGPTTPGASTTPGQAGGPGNAGSMTTSVNFGVNFGILVMLATIFIF